MHIERSTAISDDINSNDFKLNLQQCYTHMKY